MQLQGDPEDQTRFPYAELFKYLDQHLASASKLERSRLDEILYDKISDYATIIELLLIPVKSFRALLGFAPKLSYFRFRKTYLLVYNKF
jgi:hypothetical protein